MESIRIWRNKGTAESSLTELWLRDYRGDIRIDSSGVRVSGFLICSSLRDKISYEIIQ